MVKYPGVPHMGYTYLNLFHSPELLQTVVFFNCCNKALTAKLLRQGYPYHKLRKAYSIFYRRDSALVKTKYGVSLKKPLQQGISEPKFYGDVVRELEKLWGNLTFRNNSES